MEIRIDRLRLRVSGMTPESARQLGQLLAEQLAAAAPTVPPSSAGAGPISLRVSVPAGSGQRPGALAAAVAAEISRALHAATPGHGNAEHGDPSHGDPSHGDTMAPQGGWR